MERTSQKILFNQEDIHVFDVATCTKIETLN